MIKARPIAIAALGIAMRWYVSTLGYTQDLVYQFKHVEFYRQGGFGAVMNWSLVHYGPIQPALILALAKLPTSLGTSMMLFNAAVDLWIAWMLWRWVGGVAAMLFWLCPVTIIVGAYQRVTETFELALGLAAVLMLEGGKNGQLGNGRRTLDGNTIGVHPDRGKRLVGSTTDHQPVAGSVRERRADRGTLRSDHGVGVTLIAALLLGLSLSVKYDLLLLPIWLAIRKGGGDGIMRFLTLVIPYSIFVAAIIPFPGLAWKVIHYHSTNNFPLWSALNVGNVLGQVPATYLFGGTVLLLGLVFRRRPPLEQFACYCCALVAFSSALANHYLAIPVIGLACAWRR